MRYLIRQYCNVMVSYDFIVDAPDSATALDDVVECQSVAPFRLAVDLSMVRPVDDGIVVEALTLDLLEQEPGLECWYQLPELTETLVDTIEDKPEEG